MGIPPDAPSVPLLDFGSFTHGSTQQQEQFCRTLKDVLAKYGFAKLKNHMIPEPVVRNLLEWNRKFFQLPLNVKLKAAHPPQPNPHRGYSYVGQESISPISGFEKGILNESVITEDVKETFDQGSSHDQLYPNIWIDDADLPGFRQFMTEYFDRCDAMHQKLLQALALAFGLPDSLFQSRCRDNTSELRLNHYPSVTYRDLQKKGTCRIAEHSDFGLLTLLFQDSVGGLEVEVQDGSGTYLSVEPSANTEMIINVGDCLQRWTNHHLRSANHRVRSPVAFPEHGRLPDRYSIAYFGKPDRDAQVQTIAEFLDDGEVAKYTEKMSMWEYNQSKLVRTY